MPFLFLAIVAVGAWAIGRSASSHSPSPSIPPSPYALPAPSAPVIASGRAYGRGYQPPAQAPHYTRHADYRHHVPAYALAAPGHAHEQIDPRASPMHALRYYVQIGEYPPAFVVQCAVKQAELAGQYDLAREIAMRYATAGQIIDVASDPMDGGYENSVPPAPGAGQSAVPSVPPLSTAPAPAQAGASGYAAPGIPDEEMRAAYAAMGLNPDLAPQSMPSEPGPENTIVSGSFPAMAGVASPAYVPRATSSPLDGAGVDVASWQRFVELVSREAPTYRTTKHIGQFRQRRERLVELGLDPDRVSRSSDAQLVALEREISDAHHHALEGELIMYVGAYVDVPMPHAIDLGGSPPDGSGGESRRGWIDLGPRAPVAISQEQITLSGLLGLIQAAGLDGACSWLESPADRARFPNTTLAFVRCNGVF